MDATVPPDLARFTTYLTVLAAARLGGRLRGKADPADLAQEALARAVAHWPEYRGTTDAELRGWLRRILLSRADDLVRHYLGTAARDARREQPGSGPHPIDSSTASRTAVRRERAATVAAALDRLPPDYRRVLLLRTIEGLPFPEVAARMGRSAPAAKMLWARAVAAFRQTLPPDV